MNPLTSLFSRRHTPAPSSGSVVPEKTKKVTIYTLSDKRPEFLPIQYENFKLHIKDDYEFVVLNNAIDSVERRNAISKICQDRGIRCLEVKTTEKFKVIGKQEVFKNGSYANANVACAYPIKWAWQEMCDSNQKKLFVLIDSDMFLYHDISFNQELRGYDAAFVTNYRGPKKKRTSFDVTYVWNGICVFNPEKIPNLNDLNWDCGVVPKGYIHGHAVDVGGYSHFWLKKNPIKVRPITEYGMYKQKKNDDHSMSLECTLNGNFHFAFDYNLDDKVSTNFHSFETDWKEGDAILPHFPPDFQSILVKKSIRYFEQFILDKQTYPDPTIFGILEFETFDAEPAPAIVHFKGGSNYHGFSEEYFHLKLEFIKRTLGIL